MPLVFAPPDGYSVQIDRILGDMVAWPALGSAAAMPPSGALAGSQVANAPSGSDCEECASNTHLYVQVAVPLTGATRAFDKSDQRDPERRDADGSPGELAQPLRRNGPPRADMDGSLPPGEDGPRVLIQDLARTSGQETVQETVRLWSKSADGPAAAKKRAENPIFQRRFGVGNTLRKEAIQGTHKTTFFCTLLASFSRRISSLAGAVGQMRGLRSRSYSDNVDGGHISTITGIGATAGELPQTPVWSTLVHTCPDLRNS